MEITKEQLECAAVLRPVGRLDSEQAPSLERAIRSFFDEGGGNLLIDMSDVPYISSRGLRVFLIGAKLAEASGHRLAVCSLQEFVSKAFQLTSFEALFGVLGSVDDAVAFFTNAESR